MSTTTVFVPAFVAPSLARPLRRAAAASSILVQSGLMAAALWVLLAMPGFLG